MRLILLGALCLASALSVRGQDLSATPTPPPPSVVVPPPTFQSTLGSPSPVVPLVISLSPATTPAQFAEIIAAASPTQILALIAGTAANPSVFAELMQTASAETQRKIVQTLAARADALSIDNVQAADLDVLTAMLRYSVIDPRFPEIHRVSYYGVRLSQIKAQIAAEGLTATNKATLLQLYKDATDALKAFLATEAAATQ